LYPKSVFGSNTAVTASNTAIFASNTSVYASNNNVSSTFGSNTSIYASNQVVTLSNFLSPKVVFGSNTSIYASNQVVTLSNFLSPKVVFGSNTAVAASNQAFTAGAITWIFNSSNLYSFSNIGIGISNAAALLDVSDNVHFASNLTVDSNITCSNITVNSNVTASNGGFFWNTYAFKYSVPIGTLIINSNYSPGPTASTGCNNTPLNGLVAYSVADTTFPYQTITSNGFRAPVRGVYMFNVQLGITCRGFDGVQIILTHCPSAVGALHDRDTLSNIRGYSVASWESWANYFSGAPAAASDGFIFPSSFTANLNTIEVIDQGDFVQCFAVTHHGGRSNTGALPRLAGSNTPITVSFASNNIIANSNPAQAYNFFSGSLITYL
jgi:hypothetical protein